MYPLPPVGHLLLALHAHERGYFQISDDEELGSFLDVRHTLGQLAEAADGEEVRLAVVVSHRQPEISILLAALPGLPEFGVVGGVADEKGGNSLIIQSPSPPRSSS